MIAASLRSTRSSDMAPVRVCALGSLSPVCLNSNLLRTEKLPETPLGPPTTRHPPHRSLFHDEALSRSTVQQFAHVGHRTLRPIVNDELEDVGPRIMPGSVEVELAASDMFEINFGVEDRLTGKIRTREHAPERI